MIHHTLGQLIDAVHEQGRLFSASTALDGTTGDEGLIIAAHDARRAQNQRVQLIWEDLQAQLNAKVTTDPVDAADIRVGDTVAFRDEDGTTGAGVAVKAAGGAVLLDLNTGSGGRASIIMYPSGFSRAWFILHRPESDDDGVVDVEVQDEEALPVYPAARIMITEAAGDTPPGSPLPWKRTRVVDAHGPGVHAYHHQGGWYRADGHSWGAGTGNGGIPSSWVLAWEHPA